MHFLPDTEDEDAAAERYWPDSFKQVIQREVHRAIGTKLNEGSLRHIHKRQYTEIYPELSQFVGRIVDMVVIGAENGADDGFDAIYEAFLTESPLPEARTYARYFWPEIFTNKSRKSIHQAIANDYWQDDAFQHAYKVGYSQVYGNFEEFIDEVAWLVVTAVVNGVDDMLGRIYSSFIARRALPLARRNPKRLKGW
jgi:hypothetical protein